MTEEVGRSFEGSQLLHAVEEALGDTAGIRTGPRLPVKPKHEGVEDRHRRACREYQARKSQARKKAKAA